MRSHSETRQNAGNEVEREQALGAPPVAVNGEGDALHEEGEIRELTAFLELGRGHRRKPLKHLGVVWPRRRGGGKHLVVKHPRVVALKESWPQSFRWGRHGATITGNRPAATKGRFIGMIKEFRLDPVAGRVLK